MAPALLVIDLQNDFLSPEGQVRVKAFPTANFLANIDQLCQRFPGKIIFVRSEYHSSEHYHSNPPLRDDGFRSSIRLSDSPGGKSTNFLHGTHQAKRRICVPGSSGAAFIPEAADWASRFAQKVVTKTWYSAFTSTDLHQWLQDQDVGDGPLYFAGLTANNCVLATAADAFFLGYRIRVLEDCVGATSEKLLIDALKKVERYYGHVLSLKQLVAPPSDICNDGSTFSAKYDGKRTLYFVNGSIPSWRVMLLLAYKKIPYHRKRLRVMTPVRETRVQEYLEVNPRGKTPVLIDEDGTVIAESMAILEYLETYYPERRTLPDPKDKAAHTKVLERFHESENLHNAFEDVELLFADDWKTKQDQRKRILDAYRNTQKELGFWETYLSESEHVAGSSLSIADFAMYPNLAYLIHRGLDLRREGLDRLKEYHERWIKTAWGRDALPEGYEKVAKTNLIKKIYDGHLEREEA